MSDTKAYLIFIGVIDVVAIAGGVVLVYTGHPWWALLPMLAIHTFEHDKKSIKE